MEQEAGCSPDSPGMRDSGGMKTSATNRAVPDRMCPGNPNWAPTVSQAVNPAKKPYAAKTGKRKRQPTHSSRFDTLHGAKFGESSVHTKKALAWLYSFL